MQVQYVGLNAFDGAAQCAPESHGHGGIDQIELNGHAFQPGGIIRLRITMDQSMGINTLASLLVYQVGQKDFHAAPVGREEFTDVKYAQGHCRGPYFAGWGLAADCWLNWLRICLYCGF